jgi:hypothetical protein
MGGLVKEVEFISNHTWRDLINANYEADFMLKLIGFKGASIKHLSDRLINISKGLDFYNYEWLKTKLNRHNLFSDSQINWALDRLFYDAATSMLREAGRRI